MIEIQKDYEEGESEESVNYRGTPARHLMDTTDPGEPVILELGLNKGHNFSIGRRCHRDNDKLNCPHKRVIIPPVLPSLGASIRKSSESICQPSLKRNAPTPAIAATSINAARQKSEVIAMSLILRDRFLSILYLFLLST